MSKNGSGFDTVPYLRVFRLHKLGQGNSRVLVEASIRCPTHVPTLTTPTVLTVRFSFCHFTSRIGAAIEVGL